MPNDTMKMNKPIYRYNQILNSKYIDKQYQGGVLKTLVPLQRELLYRIDYKYGVYYKAKQVQLIFE